MSEDTKLDFYLKHRRQIEEWAALRDSARRALDDALLTALSGNAEQFGPNFQVRTTRNRIVKWRIPGAVSEPAWIELNWSTGSLLQGLGEAAWPFLLVVVTPDVTYRATRDRIKESTRSLRTIHGLGQEGSRSSWWVWSGHVTPTEEPITIDGYVSFCLQRFESAWRDMHPEMLRAISSASEASEDGA